MTKQALRRKFLDLVEETTDVITLERINMSLKELDSEEEYDEIDGYDDYMFCKSLIEKSKGNKS